MEVTQVLLDALSIDGAVRKHAEESLKQFQEQDLSSFLLSLSGELANEEKPVESRKLAGLILKNALDAKELPGKLKLVQRWLDLESSVKEQIKKGFLRTLESPVADVRSTTSQVIAKVAGIELPMKQWPELIGSLLSNIHQLPAHVKQAKLETLGYLCEEISSGVVDQDPANKMLAAVVQGMNATEGNNDVKQATLETLGYLCEKISSYVMDQDEANEILTALVQCMNATEGNYGTRSYLREKISSYVKDQDQAEEILTAAVRCMNATEGNNDVKQAKLENPGYLCKKISYVMDQDQVNEILTAVVQGMKSTEGNNDVRLAATRALYNALGFFARANFRKDMEHDIMRVVCEATESAEVKIRQAAFECLVSISSFFNDKLAPYIKDIFSITAKAVREDQEPVALQAIEFWSSICDKEIDILGMGSDIRCFYFIKQEIPALVPMLLETLLKQEDDQEEDGAWNIAMAGGTCLGLVARTVGDDIVPLVMPFIEENITKPDWRQRKVATDAFRFILEGPSSNKLKSWRVHLEFVLRMTSKDKYIRYWATSDFWNELNKDNFEADSDLGMILASIFIQQLDGVDGHVSGLAVKCLVSLVKKVSEPRVVEMTNKLCEKLLKDKEHRDIASGALKLIIAEISTQPLAQSILLSILSQLVKGITDPRFFKVEKAGKLRTQSDFKRTGEDEYFRYIVISDLLDELNEDNLKADSDLEIRLTNIIIQQLDDVDGDVSGLAVKCLVSLVKKVSEPRVVEMTNKLYEKWLEDREHRDITSTALETIIDEISTQSLVQSLLLSILPQLVKGITDPRTGEDEDFRYMVISDLLNKLNKDNLKADSDLEIKLTSIIIQQLDDVAGDVSRLAVKCLVPLAKKVSEPRAKEMTNKLCEKLLKDKGHRDIASTLETIIDEIYNESLVPSILQSICRQLVKEITDLGRNQEIKCECLDILCDVLHKFGNSMATDDELLLSALLSWLSSNRAWVRKKTVSCIASLASSLSDDLLARATTEVVQRLRNDDTKSEMIRTNIQMIGALSRAVGNRFGPHLADTVPVLINHCKSASENDEELREYSLQALENFLQKCPRDISPYCDEILHLNLEYLSYDPNFTANMEEDTDDETHEEEEEEDDDVSWKVRRAAVKCLSALIVSRPEMLSKLYGEACPKLIDRFEEREETIKMDVFNTFIELLQQTGKVTKGQNDRNEQSPRWLLKQEVPKIIGSINRQRREKYIKTKVGAFSVLKELVVVLPDCLADHIGSLIPGIEKALNDKSSTSNLKIEALIFTRLVLASHNPSVFHPYIKALSSPVLSAVGERSCKFTAKALRVCGELVRVVRPNFEGIGFDFKPYVHPIYNAIMSRLTNQDEDQEVRECAISCMGLVVSTFGDNLDAELPVCLPVLVDRMGNGFTQLTAVKAFAVIAASPLKIDLSCVLEQVIAELTAFLRKANWPLRQATLGTLNSLIVAYGDKIDAAASEDIILELATLIRQSVDKAEFPDSSVEKILNLLFNNCEREEESVRNVVAECLGKIALMEPAKLVPALKERTTSPAAFTRATVVLALKYSIVERPERIDEILYPEISSFLMLIKDNDPHVRHAAVLVLSTFAHNKPNLIKGLLPELLPLLYDQTVIKKELIRTVDLGPFKHPVDDGLELRKAAFECVDALLDSCLDQVNPSSFIVPHLRSGLDDHYDVKMPCHLILSKLADKCSSAVLTVLDSLVDPLQKTINFKPKQDAVKQEVDRNEDMIRSALRAVASLHRISGGDRSLKFKNLINEILKSPALGDRSSPVVGLAVRSKVLPQALTLISSSWLQGQALLALQNFFASLVCSANTSFDALLGSLLLSAKPSPQSGGVAEQALYSIALSAKPSPQSGGVAEQALYSIARCVAVLCLAAGDQQCSSTVKMLTDILKDDSTTNSAKQHLALLCLGEIGRRKDLGSHDHIENIVIESFQSPFEEIKFAASYALGNIAVGNLLKYLPFILDQIDNQQKKQYLLLHSLKEVIVRQCADKAQFPDSSVEKTLNLLFNHCGSEEERVRNVVAECLASLASSLSDDLLARATTEVVQRLRNDDTKSEMIRTNIQMIGALSRAVGNRFGPHLADTVPVLINHCKSASENDEELREYSLQALENFLQKCPRDISPYCDEILHLNLEYLSYDPNFTANMEEDTDDETHEEEDDDVSWKVRRAAVKCLSALIVSRPEMLSKLYGEACPKLIDRFEEREETVKMDVFNTFIKLLQQTGNVTKGQNDINEQSPRWLLKQEVPKIIGSINSQLDEKSIETKVGAFSVLKELVVVLPECLADHIGSLIPGIEKALNDESYTSNLKIEALIFTRLVLASHNPSVFHPYIKALSSPVLSAVRERCYEVTAEALRVCGELVRVVRPNIEGIGFDFKPYVHPIYNAIMSRLINQDQDQGYEIKCECLDILCDVLHKFGNLMATDHELLLSALLSQLSYDQASVRKKTVSCIASLASSLSEDLLAKATAEVVQKLRNKGTEYEMTRTNIQMIGALSVAVGYRFGLHLADTIPVLVNYCTSASEDDEELREYSLRALESFLLRCPRDISPYCDEILHHNLEYLSYY